MSIDELTEARSDAWPRVPRDRPRALATVRRDRLFGLSAVALVLAIIGLLYLVSR